VGGRGITPRPLMYLQDWEFCRQISSFGVFCPGDDERIGHAPTIPVTFIIFFIVKEISVCLKVLVWIWQDAS